MVADFKSDVRFALSRQNFEILFTGVVLRTVLYVTFLWLAFICFVVNVQYSFF